MTRAVSFIWALALAATGVAADEDNVSVEIVTDVGTIAVELVPSKAPETVRNFLERVDENFFDGLIFHRVVFTFVIQAGGYDVDMNYREAPETVVNESANGLSNTRGTIAMARTSDPDSAGAQFYINMKDNTSLDATPDRPGYTVFGRVTEGMEVAEQIELVDTGTVAGLADVPNEPIVIETIRRVEPED
ncbi:MAG: peptidylprolyl isomerase [Gammaproteobacteria bacterium]|nr:peptidylprolyl isomerase [Gammaproteobacteria bacterium]